MPAPADRPVLVTGGTGFIGRRLVQVLRARGTRVRVVVRRPDAVADVFASGAEPLVGDLLDPDLAYRAVRGVAGVFHLAGRLFRPGDSDDVYERLHVDVTRSLLLAAAEQNVGFFLLCSTTGVLGATRGPVAEDAPGRPENAYERTKAEAEQMAVGIARERGLNLVIARPGLVYGPGDRHLLGWFRAIRRGYYRVIGPGRNCFHPIYVDDLVQALLLCAIGARAEPRTYHLVGSRPVSVQEISNEIGSAVGRRVPRGHLPRAVALALGAAFEALPVPRARLPLTRSRVRFMTENRAYDGSRAARELGFRPSIELPAGLTRTVAWYRQEGLL